VGSGSLQDARCRVSGGGRAIGHVAALLCVWLSQTCEDVVVRLLASVS